MLSVRYDVSLLRALAKRIMLVIKAYFGSKEDVEFGSIR